MKPNFLLPTRSFLFRFKQHHFCQMRDPPMITMSDSMKFLCRCFGPKCGGCGEKIHYQDFVRKARDKVYHLRCFTCSLCSKQLSTGEVLYLQPGDEGFVCKDHYLNKGKTKLEKRTVFLSFQFHLWCIYREQPSFCQGEFKNYVDKKR